jgi:hypothetical protein
MGHRAVGEPVGERRGRRRGQGRKAKAAQPGRRLLAKRARSRCAASRWPRSARLSECLNSRRFTSAKSAQQEAVLGVVRNLAVFNGAVTYCATAGKFTDAIAKQAGVSTTQACFAVRSRGKALPQAETKISIFHNSFHGRYDQFPTCRDSGNPLCVF